MLDKNTKVKELINNFNINTSSLYELFIDIQEIYGYISDPILTIISEKLNIHKTKLLSITSSYPNLNLLVKPANNIQICSKLLCNNDSVYSNLIENMDLKTKEVSLTENSNIAFCFACPTVLIANKLAFYSFSSSECSTNVLKMNNHFDDIRQLIEHFIQKTKIKTINSELINIVTNFTNTQEFIHCLKNKFNSKSIYKLLYENIKNSINNKMSNNLGLNNFLSSLNFFDNNSIQNRSIVLIAVDFEPFSFINLYLVYKYTDFIILFLVFLSELFKFNRIVILIRNDFKFLIDLLNYKIISFQNNSISSNYLSGISFEIKRIPNLIIFEDRSAIANFLNNKRIQVHNTADARKLCTTNANFVLNEHFLYDVYDINGHYTCFINIVDLFKLASLLKNIISIDTTSILSVEQPCFITNYLKETPQYEIIFSYTKSNNPITFYECNKFNNDFVTIPFSNSIFIFNNITTNKSTKDCEFPIYSENTEQKLDSILKNLLLSCNNIIVTKANLCPVKFTYKFACYLLDQSCGNCVHCREGLLVLCNLLSNIPILRRRHDQNQTKNYFFKEGFASDSKLEIIENLLETIILSSTCYVGYTAGKFLLSIFRCFYKDFEDHYVRHQCSKKVCKI